MHIPPGCKESQFYSLPFTQAVASINQPTSHFNQAPKTLFDQQDLLQSFCNLKFPPKQHLPVRQVKNKNHEPDSKIHQPWAMGHDFLCTLPTLSLEQLSACKEESSFYKTVRALAGYYAVTNQWMAIIIIIKVAKLVVLLQLLLISIVVITILIKTIKTLSTVCKMLLTELSLS